MRIESNVQVPAVSADNQQEARKTEETDDATSHSYTVITPLNPSREIMAKTPPMRHDLNRKKIQQVRQNNLVFTSRLINL